jgi:hypothetical protein
VNDRELARLATSWQGPVRGLPQLPVAGGPPLVAALASILAAPGSRLAASGESR